MKRIVKFDIEKAKAGTKVVTRSGEPVRVLCYDNDDKWYPIVAIVDRKPKLFSDEGLVSDSNNIISPFDLFLEVEDPISSFEASLSAVLKGVRNGYYDEEYTKDGFLGLAKKYKDMAIAEFGGWKSDLSTADLENELVDIMGNFSEESHEYKILDEAVEYIRRTAKPQK